MPIYGSSWASCTASLASRSPRSTLSPRNLPLCMTRGHGCADVRLAVVSPFVDRRHGTERALAELLERLARQQHCEIHLYAQSVESLALSQPGDLSSRD